MPSTPIDDTAMRKKMPMLKSITCRPLPRQYGECQHRSYDYQIGSQGEQKAVDMFQFDKLFDKNLEHVGYRLQQAHRTDTVRT